MSMPKVMKLVDPHTGHMQCKLCGSEHFANLKHGGGYMRGSWRCVNGCRIKRTGLNLGYRGAGDLNRAVAKPAAAN
jgi:hypothetical protein